VTNRAFAVLAALLVGLAPSVYGQRISIEPRDGMIDERFEQVRVTGLTPRASLIVRASMNDSDGNLWQSRAGFRADDRGAVDLSAQRPVHGTYDAIDAMGLVWSMDRPDSDHGRARFIRKGIDPLTVTFTVESDGRTVATTAAVRRFVRPGVKIVEVRDRGLVGRLFTPDGEGQFPGVLVLGGSEGGLESEDVAALLSSHRYAALALAYFDAEGLPKSLEEIPLEYFKRGIDRILSDPRVRRNGIALVGTSKGAEASLLLGAHYREVRAVVGWVPSGVVWSCLCSTLGRSSWSLGRRPVPFVPEGTDPIYRPPKGSPIRPAVNYLYRLGKEEDVAKAAIPVERINGPVLLISAGDDQLWPSALMANRVMDRLKKRDHPFADRHLFYESAGHLIGKAYLPAGSTLIAGGRLETGGTPEANARAQADSWPRVFEFLRSSFRAEDAVNEISVAHQPPTSTTSD
jgi:dienelactone hydrolase